jgi:beta-xylosidase
MDWMSQRIKSSSIVRPVLCEVIRIALILADTAYIEGSRIYKREGNYYIVTVEPVVGEYILKSETGPFGEYEFGVLLNETKSPSGLAGGDVPHQGGIVDTPDGDWYYMSFVDVCGDSCGRVPVIAPFTWGDDGFPKLELAANNTWPETVPVPVPNAAQSVNGVHTGKRAFRSAFNHSALAPEYEWNHNPDNSKWSLNDDGVCLETATITTDLYQAKNTLTHRVIGPQSAATIELDVTNMRDGDRTGLSMFRDVSAWIGVRKDN